MKELTELYGKGTGLDHVDANNVQFQPLLMAIEASIVHYDREVARLTDPPVEILVKQMGMEPDREPADELGKMIHETLRLCLTENDYSRDDVRRCLRQVAKSVARHNRSDGMRGYLDFIKNYIL